MIKYIFALIMVALMYRVETTGNLKLIWEAFASFMTFAILYYIELLKELN